MRKNTQYGKLLICSYTEDISPNRGNPVFDDSGNSNMLSNFGEMRYQEQTQTSTNSDNDVEILLMGLNSKMKNLENKYIGNQ
jgi:hypothetical protein